jgi:hypothetical protein
MIATLVAALVASTLPHANIAARPDAVARQVVGGAVVRTNVVDPYAAVLTRGGIVEGDALDNAILVERFSFGWQAIAILNDACFLRARGVSDRDARKLLASMPPPSYAFDCRPGQGLLRDAGPRVAVEAVRRQMTWVFVPAVVVSRTFAFAQWYGGGGGESVFRKEAGRWKRILGGGGAQSLDDLDQQHVPRSASCAFQIPGACKEERPRLRR